MSEAAENQPIHHIEKPDPKSLAILVDEFGTFYFIEKPSLKELKKSLEAESEKQIVSVWKGRKLSLKKQVKITF